MIKNIKNIIKYRENEIYELKSTLNLLNKNLNKLESKISSTKNIKELEKKIFREKHYIKSKHFESRIIALLKYKILYDNILNSLVNPVNSQIDIFELDLKLMKRRKKQKSTTNLTTGEITYINKKVRNNRKKTIEALTQLNLVEDKLRINNVCLSSQLNKITHFNTINPYNEIKYNSINRARTNKEFIYDKKIQDRYIRIINYTIEYNTQEREKENTYNKLVGEDEGIFNNEEYIIHRGNINKKNREKLEELINYIKNNRLKYSDVKEFGNILFNRNKPLEKKIDELFSFLANIKVMSFEQNISIIFGDIREESKGYKFLTAEDRTKKWNKGEIKYNHLIVDKKYSIFNESSTMNLDDYKRRSSIFKKQIKTYKSTIDNFKIKNNEHILLYKEVRYKSIDLLKYPNVAEYIKDNKHTDYKRINFSLITAESTLNLIKVNNFKRHINKNNEIITYKVNGDSKTNRNRDNNRQYHIFSQFSSDERIILLKGKHEFDIEFGIGSCFRDELKKNNNNSTMHDLFFTFKSEIRARLLETINRNLPIEKELSLNELKKKISSMYYGIVYTDLLNIVVTLSNGDKFNTNIFNSEIETVINNNNITFTTLDRDTKQNAIFVLYSNWERQQMDKFKLNNNLSELESIRVHDAYYTPTKCEWLGDDTVKFGFSSWKSRFKKLIKKADSYVDTFKILKEVHYCYSREYTKSKFILNRCKHPIAIDKWSKLVDENLGPVIEFYSQNIDYHYNFNEYYRLNENFNHLNSLDFILEKIKNDTNIMTYDIHNITDYLAKLFNINIKFIDYILINYFVKHLE